uniref:60S ribosomal protein L18 n=1 Tax=Tetracapsuloides bryosalmonae TaxID=271932 RepID=I7HPL4_9CNID|nr:60S ribosomal protein L18 [Tetracapsuloides bryosalmonae]
MGVDIEHKHVRKVERREPRSENPYVSLLVKLYRFLARRAPCQFNKKVLKRLCQSRIQKPVISVARLKKHASIVNGDKKILTVVGTVTNDERIDEIPKMTVCALKFTKMARARILASGGKILSLDELAKKSPDGKNTLLLQGCRKARVACRYFGAAPGDHHSHTRPRVRSKGKNFEKARGRK